jgi:hypothetical protein
MSTFDKLLDMVPLAERSLVNAFATDRDGTMWAFYARDPRPAYQVWVSDQHSVVVGYVGPMLDDWNHSLVRRPEHPGLLWGALGLGAFSCALVIGWRWLI